MGIGWRQTHVPLAEAVELDALAGPPWNGALPLESLP
jgi:hypothetical protein